MEVFIKSEPIEMSDSTESPSTASQSLIEKTYANEMRYLSTLETELFDATSIQNELESAGIPMISAESSNDKVGFDMRNIFGILDQTSIRQDESQQQSSQSLATRQSTTVTKKKLLLGAHKKSCDLPSSNRLKILNEKKKILHTLNDLSHCGESGKSLLNEYEMLKPQDEVMVRRFLNSLMNAVKLGSTSQSSNDNDENDDRLLFLKRFSAKLELRELKRRKRLKLFDLDTYVNELIDHETARLEASKDNKQMAEKELLVTNGQNGESDCEIVAVKSVLDRFKSSSVSQHASLHEPSIGFVARSDTKCESYVRRDRQTRTIKMRLNEAILARANGQLNTQGSIDYVQLRPEHVLAINTMCKQHFWNGIDITECLRYHETTVVALYKKLIVGFALVVLNEATKDNYLSFIFVHPDWRLSKAYSTSSDCSIAQFMLFYLIQVCDGDITLHVSANSPAVIFYQKFGFKIEEYIQNFYDKYYSDEHNLNKDAFFMRLSKTN